MKLLIKSDLVNDGNEYVPLDIDEDPGLILSTNQPLEFKFGLSFKTYPVTLMNTPKNNLLLKNLFNKNIQRPVEFSDIYMVIDNIYFKSVLYITNFNNFGARGQITSSAGYIWYLLQNKHLRDFDYSKYEHNLTYENVTDQNLFDRDIIYDFIYRGKGVYDDQIMKNVDVVERRPAIRLKSLLEVIFEDYNVIQKVWDEDRYENIYITPTGQDLLVSDDWYANSYIDNIVELDSQETYGNTNLTNISGINTYWFKKWWNMENGLENIYTGNTFTYVASETASYRFAGRLKGNYTISSNTPGYWRNRSISVFIVKTKLDNTTETYTFNINSLPNLFTSFIDEDYDITFDSKLIHLEKDESISIEIKYENREFNASNDPIIPPQTQTILGYYDDASYFKVNPFPHKGWNSLITGDDIIPDMRVNELMTTLLTNFNIEFYYNFETQTIYLQNRYVYPPPYFDITDKVNESSYSVDLKRPPQNYFFGYTKDDNDFFFDQEVQLKFRDDGNLFIDNEEDSTIFDVSNSFSYNMVRLSDPKIIQMTTEEEIYTTRFNPRLMYFNGFGNWEYTLHSAGIINPTTSSETQIPYFSTIYNGETLSFNNKLGNIGIYEKYYNSNIDRLLEGNVVEVDLFVDEHFLSDIYFLTGRDFRAVYYIDTPGIQGYYQIVNMEKKEDYIYRTKLFRDSNYNFDTSIDPPTPSQGDWNDDWNDDWGSVQVRSGNGVKFTYQTTSSEQVVSFQTLSEDYSTPHGFSVDWGDGSELTYQGTSNETISRTIQTPGIYEMEIKGNLKSVNFEFPNIRILDILSWGEVGAFDGIINWRFEGQQFTDYSATDVPNFLPNSSMERMFYQSNFNFEINYWETAIENVKNMDFLFYATPFNQPLSIWITTNVESMESTFELSPFNQILNTWGISNVKSTKNMFKESPFNNWIGDGGWTSIETMSGMFQQTTFNMNIGGWELGSNIRDVSYMFAQSSFNYGIFWGGIFNIENFEGMFAFNGSFNGDITGWNTSSALNMDGMFIETTSFNRNLTNWCVVNIPTEPVNFSTGSALDPSNKPLWGTCP